MIPSMFQNPANQTPAPHIADSMDGKKDKPRMIFANCLHAFKTHIFLFLFWTLAGINGLQLSITWTPSTQHKQNDLAAIQSHLLALTAAEDVPRWLGLERNLTIRLCPPSNDPLFSNFQVPLMNAYSAIYDPDCQMAQNTDLWGSKPKPHPPQQSPGKPVVHTDGGLSLPQLIWYARKAFHHPQSPPQNEIWLINSESLRVWLKSSLLRSLTGDILFKTPAHRLMRQINVMTAATANKELKAQPQAIQGALLIALPNYAEWNNSTRLQNVLFNPTWWSNGNIPRKSETILKTLKEVINSQRRNQQLIIIMHDPTSMNAKIISDLRSSYGEQALLSFTQVLPKTANALQRLQFAQKADKIIVDSRDAFGQAVLTSVGPIAPHLKLLQDFLPKSTCESALWIACIVWVLGVFACRVFFTYRNYSDPLDKHVLRIALFLLLAFAPLIMVYPSMWPSWLSALCFNLFEMKLEWILLVVVAIYIVALVLTNLAILLERHKRKRALQAPDGDSDNEDNAEEVSLIPQ